MDDTIIKLKKLVPEAKIPTYAHPDDFCADVACTSMEYNPEKDIYIYHTGLAFESEADIGLFMFVRSSNNKTDCYLTNHVGIIDSAIYRGEIIFCFKNRDSIKTLATNASIPFILNGDLEKAKANYDKIIKSAPEFAPYNVGDRIGQMCAVSKNKIIFEHVDELSQTDRGGGGFGSTGN